MGEGTATLPTFTRRKETETMTATLQARTIKQARPRTDHTTEAGPGYLITDAGMEALRTAAIVPDDLADENDLVLTGEEDAPADAFMPDTKEKADWVLSKIADARGRAARIRENAERMARDAEREAEGLEWRYGAALQALCRKETEGGRRKSLPLYHGVIGFRTKPAGVSITDDVAALSWARENAPGAVTERLDRKALGDALKDSGEVLPFAQFTPAEETFYIK